VQVALHWPAAQIGVAPEHCALVVHVVPPLGSQTVPFTHAEPLGHCPPAHDARHAPSSQTSPDGHWLSYWQAFADAVQVPPTQTWLAAHSVLVVHAHGPSVPPQVGPASTVPEEEPEDDPDEEPELDDETPEDEPELEDEDPDEEPELDEELLPELDPATEPEPLPVGVGEQV
jgi:hypothetical protein